MKNVVVIGGGHGQSTIIKGLKDLDDINLSAIVTISDDGGSTGRLRERYNIPAVGDIRNVMLAMSNVESMPFKLMDYRFKGNNEEDVEGHSLGNLILAALFDMEESLEKSINLISNTLKLKGNVIPVSDEIVSLYATMEDGTIVKGEKNIPSVNNHINNVFYDHKVKATNQAIEVILNADIVIYGIGSLYTSIMPIVIIDDIKEALRRTKAKKIYMANCMTQNNETFDYDLKEHENAFIYNDVPIDLIISHNNTIPEEIRNKYLKENSIEVIDNNNTVAKVYKADLLDFSQGLVRHNSEKIKNVIKGLL